MKAKDLKNILEIYPEYDIVVTVSEPGIGPTPTVGISHFSAGIDWDHGKFKLIPELPLSKKSQPETVWHLATDFLILLTLDKRRTKKGIKYTQLAEKARRLLVRAGYTEEQLDTHRNMYKVLISIKLTH